MSKDLALLSTKPTWLAEVNNDQAAEFDAGIAGGMALPTLSIRGKEFRFRFNGEEQSTRLREIEVIFVASRPAVSKRFYAEGYSPGETAPPDCSSTTGIAPDGGENKQSDRCGTCPHNQWGSKVTPSGKLGKACADYKRVVVKPFINGKMTKQSVVLDVPAASLKSPKGYQGDDLFLREYMAALNRHGVPPTGAVSKVYFTDAEYPQLVFGFVRYAEEAEHAAVQEDRESEDVQSVLSAEGVEPKAPITQAAPAEPEPKPAHTPEPEQEQKAAEPVPEPKQEQKYAAAEPVPVAMEPGPVKEEAAGDEDDAMAEVEKLLAGGF